MVRRFAVLDRIEGVCIVSKEQNGEFLFHLQTAMLLALKEQGKLSEAQFLSALKKVQQEWGKQV